ncbi:hypothetical protein [Janthinobacterium sp. HH01]|uniref:hypothetical protein n=1 Tax=Janthinobacterium sp. HH01 TaxID=1198452 RepID=UPI0012687B29|nr:hypothetical protein [Janthinobacterium sp. HH01]
MKTIRISLASLLLSFSAQMARAQTVDAPPLHLQLPSTWTLDSARRPMEGHGPDGEKMLVTIARALPNKTTTAREDAHAFAQSVLKDVASRNGKLVVRAVEEFPVPEGKTAYSSASESSRMFRKYYFIQYLLASENAMFYFTFEGKGEALPALKRFDALMNEQRWDE